MSFYAFDFDLNQVTLVLKIDLDMAKMHLYTEMKSLAPVVQKL